MQRIQVGWGPARKVAKKRNRRDTDNVSLGGGTVGMSLADTGGGKKGESVNQRGWGEEVDSDAAGHR